MNDSDIMRPAQVRDLTARLFKQRDTLGDIESIDTVTSIGDKKLVVTFKDGTRAVLSVAVYRAQDSTEGE